MQSKSVIGSNISIAADFLRNGQLVGIPTETVYGLGANALDDVAVTQIFKVKGRPFFDPLIIHLSSVERIYQYVNDFSPLMSAVANQLMPGPITLLLDRKEIIPDLITSGLSRVAVRIPSHPMTLDLLNRLDFPVAAPSANPFGYISPTTAQHVADQLGDQIPYILDGGPCTVGIESTIVGEDNGHLVVYRKGGVSIERLRSIDPELLIMTHSESHPAAPGMLQSHYAPQCAMKIVEDFNDESYQDRRIGTISFTQKVDFIDPSFQGVLSPNGDYGEAARNLFKTMRYLDSLNLDLILVKLLPEEDLGIAINDRLRRAAV